MVIHAVAAIIGFILDLGIGDPQGWWHPVQGIGWLIEKMESLLRRCFPKTNQGELIAGSVLVAFVLFITGGITWWVLAIAGALHPTIHFSILCGMSWWILATKSLKVESMKVYSALKEGDVERAREAVSMIVGRDTNRLTEEGIVKATVETVAENTSDGVIAPLFYLFVGGPIVGFLYKAINTMDSMIGYKNQRYLYFGRAAALLDDVVNLIPARLSALCLIGASMLLGYDGARAFRIWRRDGRCHKSPNSAQGEAACAGALGIQLAGDAYYFGKLHEKLTIGDATRPVEYEDIRRVNLLLYGSAMLAVIAGGGVIWYAVVTEAISIEMILPMIFLSM